MVVGTLWVVAVIVEGGVWILGSTICLRHPRRMERGGKKREQSNCEYSSKVLTSKDVHYICIGINEMGCIYGLDCRKPEEKGKA